MSSVALIAIAEAPVFELAASARTRVTEAPALTPAPDLVVEITITELVRIEERLAIQEQLGDLHPAHAARLAAVSAELDRRWATFA